jgi:hypothetical protein
MLTDSPRPSLKPPASVLKRVTSMVKQLKCFCKSPPFRVFEKRGLGGVSNSVIGRTAKEDSLYFLNLPNIPEAQ